MDSTAGAIIKLDQNLGKNRQNHGAQSEAEQSEGARADHAQYAVLMPVLTPKLMIRSIEPRLKVRAVPIFSMALRAELGYLELGSVAYCDGDAVSNPNVGAAPRCTAAHLRLRKLMCILVASGTSPSLCKRLRGMGSAGSAVRGFQRGYRDDSLSMRVRGIARRLQQICEDMQVFATSSAAS